MIVCVCRAVSDREIRARLRDGMRSLSQLRSELGVASCCGKCGPRLRELVDEHSADAERELPAFGCACAGAA